MVRLNVLDMLLKMAARRGKREHAMALDTLKDLFDNDLLPDNKLKYFHQQPLHVLPAGEVFVCFIPMYNTDMYRYIPTYTDIYRYLLTDNKQSATVACSTCQVLVFWYFEDAIYTDIYRCIPMYTRVYRYTHTYRRQTSCWCSGILKTL
jgi:hypothetical protein